MNISWFFQFNILVIKIDFISFVRFLSFTRLVLCNMLYFGDLHLLKKKKTWIQTRLN